MGNSRARAVYEANLPDNFRRPQTDSALEAFIRSKYEHKKYIAKEWVPPPLPKVKISLILLGILNYWNMVNKSAFFSSAGIYYSWRVFAAIVICFHSSLLWTIVLHFSTPIFLRSFSTWSNYLFLGRLRGLFPVGMVNK